ncbi:MAG: hypothetical protein GY798_21975 [Hyphomicrobiales bacterium]|nr:hypothetical protein [Hyphomicrobiales bacterium]
MQASATLVVHALVTTIPRKHLGGVPEDLRAARCWTLIPRDLIATLNTLAKRRGESLARMALTWVLRDDRVTPALIGTRTVQQLNGSLDALNTGPLSDDEITEIGREPG